MKLTFKERLIAGLLAMGYVVDNTDKSRYTAFVKLGQKRKLFVGENGALRVGRCASKSFSLGDPSRLSDDYQRVLAVGTPKEPSFD